MANKKRKSKRGYPLCTLVLFEPMKANIWKIFSERAITFDTLKFGRKYENSDKNQLYQIFENLVNKLRPIIKEGQKSIIFVCPRKKNYCAEFMKHIEAHHQWMFRKDSSNKITFQIIEANISNPEQMQIFIQSKLFHDAIGVATSEEADDIMQVLEKRLNNSEEGLVLYKIKEIEDLVYAGGKRKKKFKPLKLIPEYIILTDIYLDQSTQKSRINRLLQIAQNRNILTKIIDSEAPSGERLTALGGIACFLKVNSQYEKELGKKIIEK